MTKFRLWLASIIVPHGIGWVAPWEMSDAMWAARRKEYREGRTYNDGWRAMRDAHLRPLPSAGETT